jgi:bleomycin hydrolase
VSNPNFRQRAGYAMQWRDRNVSMPVKPDAEETEYNQDIRQQLFENLTTQDDHLMHIVGLEKSPSGKKFFLVKNSWGDIGPFKGYIHVSEAYFAINTITLVLPKAALPEAIKRKLDIK